MTTDEAGGCGNAGFPAEEVRFRETGRKRKGLRYNGTDKEMVWNSLRVRFPATKLGIKVGVDETPG